jgi:hypothetical protein
MTRRMLYRSLLALFFSKGAVCDSRHIEATKSAPFDTISTERDLLRERAFLFCFGFLPRRSVSPLDTQW